MKELRYPVGMQTFSQIINEYDKPLLEIEDNKELFEKNQSILKSFFGNLKSMDKYIRFAFITGVARFSKA